MQAPTAWTKQLVEFFGIDAATALELTALIDDASCWLGSRIDGVSVLRVPLPDPRVRGVLARGAPGSTLPARPSDSVERLLVLQGSVIDPANGQILGAGQQVRRPPGEHSPLKLTGTQECLFCIWVGPPDAATR